MIRYVRVIVPPVMLVGVGRPIVEKFHLKKAIVLLGQSRLGCIAVPPITKSVLKMDLFVGIAK